MPVNQSSKSNLFGTQPRLRAWVAGGIATALVTALATMTGPALAWFIGDGEGPFVVQTAVSLPSGQTLTAVDISFVDPVAGVYLLADRTNKSIDVINTTTSTFMTQLHANFAGIVFNPGTTTANNNLSGPDGVMLVDHKTVWAGDGGSFLKIIDLNSGALLKSINTGSPSGFRVDEMCFDPVHRIVAAANNADNPPFITMVAADAPYNVLGTITFDGTKGTPNATNGIEQCQWAPQIGKFIVAVPEVNGPGDNTAPGGVSVIDPVAMKVTQTYVITDPACRGPQGTAIGPNNQLALNCNATTTTVIIDVTNGKTIADLAPGSGAGDMVWYNPGNGRYYFTNSNLGARGGPVQQTLAVVDAYAPFAGGAPALAASITSSNKAAPSNHSVAADPVRNLAYFPVLAGSNASPGLCSSGGGNDAAGCIAVIFSPDDTMCTVQGAPVISVGGGFMQSLCSLHAVP
jgi:hypothetical protein